MRKKMAKGDELMVIPRNLSGRLETASPIATQIIRLLNTSRDQCEVLLCGSSLNPDNQRPRDMDFAVVQPMIHDFTAIASRLRNLFPMARIDCGKHYRTPARVSGERLHLWLLSEEDFTTNERIQRTLRSGRLFDRNSNKWMQPIS